MIEEMDVILHIFYQVSQLVGGKLLIFTKSISLEKVINLLRELSKDIDLGLMIYLSTTLLPFMVESMKKTQVFPHLFILSLNPQALLVQLLIGELELAIRVVTDAQRFPIFSTLRHLILL